MFDSDAVQQVPIKCSYTRISHCHMKMIIIPLSAPHSMTHCTMLTEMITISIAVVQRG